MLKVIDSSLRCRCKLTLAPSNKRKKSIVVMKVGENYSKEGIKFSRFTTRSGDDISESATDLELGLHRLPV
jgi:hypothetical protein